MKPAATWKNVTWTELDEFSDSVEDSLRAHAASVDELCGL